MMHQPFDPYYRWLSIPPEEQPPNHYRLLGVPLFESHPDVIETAGDRQMAHLRTFQGGPHAVLSQRLLNEVAAAKICLLTPSKKAAYDATLRAALEPVEEPWPAFVGQSSPLEDFTIGAPKPPKRTRISWRMLLIRIITGICLLAILPLMGLGVRSLSVRPTSVSDQVSAQALKALSPKPRPVTPVPAPASKVSPKPQPELKPATQEMPPAKSDVEVIPLPLLEVPPVPPPESPKTATAASAIGKFTVLADGGHNAWAGGEPGNNIYVFEIQEPVPLERTAIRFSSTKGPSNGRLELSLDGKTWKPFGRWTAATCAKAYKETEGWQLIPFTDPQEVKRIHVRFIWESEEGLTVHQALWVMPDQMPTAVAKEKTAVPDEESEEESQPDAKQRPKPRAKPKSRVQLLEEREVKNLLGTWVVDVDAAHAEWTFREDGKLIDPSSGAVTGTWKIEPTAVRITWPTFMPKSQEHCWESFYRPIRATDVRGDSWRGQGMVRAVKRR